MPALAPPLARLVEELRKLPGVGPKVAQRFAFHLLRAPAEDCERLAAALRELRQSLRSCSVCHTITDADPCEFCASPDRNRKLICVVEQPSDIVPVEKTGHYRGLYHVLGGALNPLDGIGPDKLKIQSLLDRLGRNQVEEVILATNPNAEGESTAHYLVGLIKPLGVRVTRLAQGVPMGSELEYTDTMTLQRALEGRREL